MDIEEKRLFEELGIITGLDERAMEAARARQQSLAKPPHSLGRLEDISVQLAGISGKILNKIEKKRLIVLCADNGVVSEGVASAPQSVTRSQAVNLTRGVTGAGVLWRIDLRAVSDKGDVASLRADRYIPEVSA